ncbi:MAG: sortase [Clostridiales bacterium]|jgi:LPXTG-site transpeptidase (sortase) family protein|nr:sortase [Clostridiales bacterium]
MKKLSKIVQRVFPIIFFLLAITSLVVIVIGICKIYYADKHIKDGYSAVEARLEAALDHDSNNDDSKNNGSNIPNSGLTPIQNDEDSNLNQQNEDSYSYIDDTLLTFKLKSDYKTAVFTGVTTDNLKNGSARLESSAKPGKVGNCIIYGHRDSSFKAIKYLEEGDIIEILTLDGLTVYTVDSIYVTDPSDENIFQTSDKKMLTLVTCYPFILSGPADERCIVVAYAN